MPTAIPNEDLQRLLKDFILRELHPGKSLELDATTPLLEWGILDSLGMMSLIRYLEERLQLRIPDTQLLPENFVNLEALTRLLTTLSSAV